MSIATQQGGGSGSSGLYDVLELVVDRGLVIDAFARVSLVGIEILKIDTRVVIAGVDTYLRFAEHCNRLDLEAGPREPAELTESPDSSAQDRSTAALPRASQPSSGAADTVSSALDQSRGEEREPEGRRVAREED
ncbi:gas vesicle protein GvpJ [Streptomyces collinus]|uniref:Gas vesicle protein A n=1 Tax=Streptomyces collinus (strain DSM 40733 / Tue 365) TaxID=1214242 RepID=S5VRS2_STRC3|nr:gas vesicle protein GvpJ [Streptomyces collinus]AGS67247.1 gas vesicle synthesis-like protein [Streptomyces collinus Tu 365]AGS73447.1 gas vesicle synthesis-like protein [Streptomyces collinus Tu 365]